MAGVVPYLSLSLAAYDGLKVRPCGLLPFLEGAEGGEKHQMHRMCALRRPHSFVQFASGFAPQCACYCVFHSSPLLALLSVLVKRACTLQQALPSDKASRAQWWYPLLKMGAGSGAAVVAQMAVYPLDTLRRRLQVNGSQVSVVERCLDAFDVDFSCRRTLDFDADSLVTMVCVRVRVARAQLSGPRYAGAVDCLRTMWRTEGLRALYRGCAVSCLRTAPGAAVQFVAYDAIKTGIALVDPTTGVSSPL